MEVKEKEKAILNNIYLNVYKKIGNNNINIFLCGGVKTNPNYIRDKVRDLLVKDDKINILYPEDMFLEKLAKDKESDLLSCEKFLADNSDYIFIICESPGSLVELGAFVNNSDTFHKVIVLIDQERKKDKSFIMLGPVKYVKKHNKNNVIFYDKKQIDKVSQDILKRIKMDNRRRINKFNDINRLVGLKEFITILIYFIDKIDYLKLEKIIENIYRQNGYEVSDLASLISASLKLLYKEKIIYKESSNEYKLTQKAYEKLYKKMYFDKNSLTCRLYDRIRFDIMYLQFYKNSSF